MRKSPRHLLFLVQTDWFFRSHRLPLALAALEQGYRVSLACRVTQHASELRALGIELYPLKFIGGYRLNPLREAIALLEILFLYLRLRPSIVHHVSLRPVLLGSLAARILRIKGMVNAVTGLGYLFASEKQGVAFVRKVVISCLRWGFAHPGSTVVFQNRDDREEMIRHGLLDETQGVLIHGSGVDLSGGTPSHDNNPPVVLFGARMLREKGASDLVEAARLLHKRGIPGRIFLAGAPDSGNPGALAESELRGWNEEGVVEWLGHRDDMPELMAQADIACLPSYYREGIPKFLIEATASGLPIVTTDLPGCRETVLDGVNGILVPARDPERLADALEMLLTNPTLRSQMGAASRKLAEERFDLREVVRAHMAIYNSLSDHDPGHG